MNITSKQTLPSIKAWYPISETNELKQTIEFSKLFQPAHSSHRYDGIQVDEYHCSAPISSWPRCVNPGFAGGRISLLVAAVATLVSVVIGVSYGAMAAWLGGRWERS